MEKELWKPLKGVVDKGDNYEVSSLGNVRNCVTSKVLKPRLDRKGYFHVALYHDAKGKEHKVHRLVALAFIPNPENKPQVNHKRGKEKTNNKVDNLEWATPSENIQHAFDSGLMCVKGDKSPAKKLTKEKVIAIKKLLIQKVTAKEIAQQFEMSEPAITAIKRGDSWSNVHVDGFTPNKDRNKAKGERRPSAKLTDSDVLHVRKLYKEGTHSLSKLAKQYEVGVSTIGNIVNYKTWKHLP